MYPSSIYFGLKIKVSPVWVHWAQRIYYLGTWTLRVRDERQARILDPGGQGRSAMPLVSPELKSVRASNVLYELLFWVPLRVVSVPFWVSIKGPFRASKVLLRFRFGVG